MTARTGLFRLLPLILGTPARRNSAGSLVIQGSQRLARIATIVAAAAVLDPVRFAGLAVALALTDIVRSGLLAYDVSAVRLLSGGARAPEVMGSHLAAKLGMGLLGSIAIVLFSVFAYGAETTSLAVVMSVGVLSASVASLLLVRRQVEFRLGSAASAVTFGSVLGAVLATAGLLVTGQPTAVAAGLALGDIVTLLALATGLREARRPRLRDVADVIGRAWTLLLMQIAYVGQFRIGIIILGAVGTAVAVGEYTVASRIAEGLVIMAAAVTASSLPLLGGAFARGDSATLHRTVSTSYRLALLAAAPLVAILALTAPLWIALLFPRYPGAALVFIPVGLTVIVFFASSQTTAFLNASHRDPIAAFSATVGLAVAVVGSWWLVPFAAIGIALARLVAEFVRLAIETAAIFTFERHLIRSMGEAWLTISPLLVVIVGPAFLGWSVGIAVVGGGITAIFTVLALVRLRDRRPRDPGFLPS